MENLKEGNKVCLINNETRAMEIEKVHGDTAICFWEENEKFNRKKFKLSVLKLYEGSPSDDQ